MVFVRGCAALCLLWVLGCSESSGDGPQATRENAATGEGPRMGPLDDDSTDRAVSLLDTDGGTSATRNDAGAAGSGGDEPALPPPMATADAGPSEPEPAPTDDDEDSEENGADPEPDASTPEPEDPNGGGLVGTVCDLLGGLLCPVGLLCVEGRCAEP